MRRQGIGTPHIGTPQCSHHPPEVRRLSDGSRRRSRWDGRRLQGHPARPRPACGAEGHRGRAARRSARSRALPARVACRGGDRAPERHPDRRLRRARRAGLHRHALRRRRRPAPARRRSPGRLHRSRPRRSWPRSPTALDAAHDAGVVHRDVKPANILLGAHDQVYLSDFGLARHALSEGGLTAPGGWVGTMDFMAPEQIRGERVDRRADVYALGCVLHFALTGQVAVPARGRRGAPVGASARGAAAALARRARGAGRVRRDRPPRPREAARGRASLRRGAGGGGARGRRQRARRARDARPAAAVNAATAATWPDRAPRRARRRGAIAAVALIAAAAGAVAAMALRARWDRDAPAAISPPPAPAIAAAAGKPPGGKEHVPAPHVMREIPVGVRPVNLEVAAGSVWVASTGTKTLDRVPVDGTAPSRTHPRVRHHGRRRPARRAVGHGGGAAGGRPRARLDGHADRHPIAMIGTPRAIDAGEGAVWVAEQTRVAPTTSSRSTPIRRRSWAASPLPRGSTTSAPPTARSGSWAAAHRP